MKNIIVRAVLGIVLLGYLPLSSAESKVDELVDSCNELVGIYKSRSEKNLKAAITTSLSEALRAGYCRGVLEEHANHTRGCSSYDWLDQAKFIANQVGYEDNFRSPHELLRMACNG